MLEHEIEQAIAGLEQELAGGRISAQEYCRRLRKLAQVEYEAGLCEECENPWSADGKNHA